MKSSYQIFWIEVVATEGKISMADAKKAGLTEIQGEGFRDFPNKEAAEEYVNTMAKMSLKKEYRVYIITDKQFGLSVINHKRHTIMIEKTSKQIENSVII